MNDELTLKDILFLLKDYFKEIKRSWKILVLSCTVLALVFAYKSYITLPSFKADTKFYLENDNGGLSGLGGLLGQIGLNKGSRNNPFQVLEVARSRQLLSQVLFYKKKDKDEYLANEILKQYQLNQKLAESNPFFINFEFKHSNIDSFSYNERISLFKVQNIVLKGNPDHDALRTINYDEDNGYFEIKTNTISDTISLKLSNLTYDFLKNHYENRTILNLEQSRDILKTKADSVKNELVSKMYKLNRFGDRSQQLISNEVRTKKDILEKEVTGLSLVHAEIVRQLELTNFSLENSNEMFILIDRPFEPLFPIKPELWIEIIKGFLFGLILSTLFIVSFKVIKDNLE